MLHPLHINVLPDILCNRDLASLFPFAHFLKAPYFVKGGYWVIFIHMVFPITSILSPQLSHQPMEPV